MTIPLGVGALLAEAGDLTVDLLSRASAWQTKNGGTIERALLATGAITEEVLTAALSRAYGLPGVSRATLASSDPDIVACLPAEERRRLRAFPFALSGKRLKVAMCGPSNPVLQKNLAATTGFEVELHIAPEPILEDLIASFEGQAAGAEPGPSSPAKPAPPAAGTAHHDLNDRRGRFPKFDSSCRHIETAHFALCPRCGDVL